MKPYVLIFDNFLRDPEQHLNRVLSGRFEDHRASEDGVTYPGINKHIPMLTYLEFRTHLERAVGATIIVRNLFARLTSSAQAPAPNQIHSDYGMGELAAHVYLSEHWPEPSGTSFWRHKLTQSERAEAGTDFPLLHGDSNDLTKWEFLNMAQGKFNRCLIHDATLWHCAEPVGGWGTGAQDGRLVLTCFFDMVK